MKIENLSIGHYDEMIALWKSVEGISITESDTKESLAKYLKYNQKFCFGVFENEELIGTCLAGTDWKRGYIQHVCISEKFQKKGFAKKCIQKSLEALKKEGIAKSHIFVLKENVEGKLFWDHLNWKTRHDVQMMSFQLE